MYICIYLSCFTGCWHDLLAADLQNACDRSRDQTMKLLFSYYQCFLRVNLFKVATTWWAGLSIPDKFSLIFFNLFFTKGAEISGPRVPKLNFEANQNETYAYETGPHFTCLLVQTYKYWPSSRYSVYLIYWYKSTNTDETYSYETVRSRMEEINKESAQTLNDALGTKIAASTALSAASTACQQLVQHVSS
jgi:hypothetical protein